MIKAVAMLFLAITLLFGCNSLHQKQQPVKIIFDTDMGSDCDDAGALALLHVYADRGKAEILSCNYSSGKICYGVGIIDAINTYFGRPDIPVGADYETDIGDPKDKMRAEWLLGNFDFGNDIVKNSDATEQTKLNREILLRQKNNSVTYLTVGHTNGLYELLVSEPDEISPLSGKELIHKKVKCWVAMGGLEANNQDCIYTKDWNFFRNGTAPSTAFLVKNFPKPFYIVATGSDIFTGKSLLETPENNIIRKAYETWLENTTNQTLSDQRPSWDLIGVYYAVIGLGEYLQREEPGYLDFDTGKGAIWIRGKNEKQHHFILTKKEKKKDFEAYLNEMIATQPSEKIK